MAEMKSGTDKQNKAHNAKMGKAWRASNSKKKKKAGAGRKGTAKKKTVAKKKTKAKKKAKKK